MSKLIIVLSNGNKLPTPIADKAKTAIETAFNEAFNEQITFEPIETPEPPKQEN